jgi:hypothetical protein
MFLPKLLALLISFFGGLIVNHWIARRIFATTAEIKEREILLHGLLVSLILNGVLGTYLAVLKIFNLYAFASVFIGLIFLLRKDLHITLQTIAESAHELYKNLCRFNLLTIGALCLLGALFAILAVLCRVPTQNPDAWAFHLPIAFSIIKNSGFVYPIIDHIHYASQPSFMSVLFAEMMSIVPDFSLAAFVNVLLYLFMFIALASVWDNFALALCILLVFVAANVSFATGAPTPLTDLSRSCLSVLGLTYLALYRDRKVAYYAGLAAICLGASIAAKYTELLSLSIMALLLGSALKSSEGRRLILKCALIIALIASFWYVKNLVLLNNPIYPFIFGHPGLSDTWMKDYMLEMTTAFDPAHRHFVHNLFTSQGWIDFFSVAWTWFFEDSFIAKLCLLLCILGTIIYPRLIAPMFGCTIFLFMFWYVVMFNHVRWAKPAYLLLFVTGCFVAITFFEKLSKKGVFQSFQIMKFQANRTKIIFSLMLVLLLAGAFAMQKNHLLISEKMTSQWSFGRTADLIYAAFRPNGLEPYLAKNREGYLLYQYIVRHDLKHVFQPFHHSHRLYAKIYNGGAEGDWFVDEDKLLLFDAQAFIKSSDIQYFVTRPQLVEINADRVGIEKIRRAYDVLHFIKPGAELILEDDNGWKLYKVRALRPSITETGVLNHKF